VSVYKSYCYLKNISSDYIIKKYTKIFESGLAYNLVLLIPTWKAQIIQVHWLDYNLITFVIQLFDSWKLC